MTFIIDQRYDGCVLLSYLKSTLRISRSSLASLKRDPQGLTVNGSHVTVRYRLCAGDVLNINEVDSYEDENANLIPVDIPIDVIFENNDITVVNKPPYMPTHPSHGHIDDTLANGIAYMYKQRQEPFVFRPIGRLDRNTSGISLIAKHSISASFLFYARQKHLIKKKYIAILCGETGIGDDYRTIDTYMKRQTESIIVRCVGTDSDPDAFRAITHWKPLYSGNGISVVEAIPETGRTHQLRVHFAHIGHPILGDDVYGSESEFISRHALHAAYLSLPLPYDTDNCANFFTMPPEDMNEALIRICGLSFNDVLNKYLPKEQET